MSAWRFSRTTPAHTVLGLSIVVMMSGAASVSNTGCTLLPIPQGQCWHDMTYRIGDFRNSSSGDACCSSCENTRECTVWVRWKPNASATWSCVLFSARAPTTPCKKPPEYMAGTFNRPLPPPPPPPLPPAPKGALDVIMIAADDMRPELGCYGCKHMKTPNLDAFAADAVVFDATYVAVAWCSPSRTALLTSRRPDTSMTWSVVPSEYWRDRGGNFTTLPQIFKERSYLTLAMGKIFHPGAASGDNDEKYSWSEQTFPYDDEGSACPTAKFNLSSTTRHETGRHDRAYDGDGDGADNGLGDGDDHQMETQILEGGNAMSPAPNTDSQLATCANNTLRHLATLRKEGHIPQPFFLAIGFHKPHIPWTVPQEFYDLYPLDEIELAENKLPPHNYTEIALNDILSGYWTSFSDFKTLLNNGSISADNPYDGVYVKTAG